MIEGLIARLGPLSPAERRHVISQLTPEHQRALAVAIQGLKDNPWMRWQSDPVGFVTDALGETLWRKQREILEAVRDHPRTTVSAGNGPGKSHIAARAVAWFATCHPPGTVKVVTTATTFRQVRNVLWPHIRRIQSLHGLPGTTNQVEWHNGRELLAYGFSAESNNEAALQGIHEPFLLIVIDEAAGISHTLGVAMEALMTGDNTHLLVIGNPPTDEEGTWFEKTTTNPLYHHIKISAFDTPAYTGEDEPCRTCPPILGAHMITKHLVSKQWVQDQEFQYGTDSPFYIARVLADFPKSSVSRVIPTAWLERATAEENASPGVLRLGVDIASDGGDELAVGVADGMHGYIRKTWQGSDLESAPTVAGYVWEQMLWAAEEHKRRGLREPVRVKIDALGVGWGVVGFLQQWVSERNMGDRLKVVPVKVSERAKDHAKFINQRAEMWWNGRTLVQPVPAEDGEMRGAITIEPDVRMDRKANLMAQLAGPKYEFDSSGRIKVEKKVDMAKRGIPSPDRAEALLLAFFEPPGFIGTVGPVSLTKENHFVLK